MRTIFAAVLYSVVLGLGCNATESGPPFKPIADVKTLMTAVVDPAADIFWDSVGTIISEEGVDEWYPKTDEEWAAVKGSAVVIMEAGNLLMIGDRARDNQAWMRMAEEMIDAGALALEAVESKDPDAVFAIGENVYNACNNCHNLYWVGDEARGRIRE